MLVVIKTGIYLLARVYTTRSIDSAVAQLVKRLPRGLKVRCSSPSADYTVFRGASKFTPPGGFGHLNFISS